MHSKSASTSTSTTTATAKSVYSSQNLSHSPFKSRNSLLDVKSVDIIQKDSLNLTGFYHLSWIILTLFVIKTFISNFLKHGYFLNGIIAKESFYDFAGVLLLEFFVLIAVFSTFSTVVCFKADSRRNLSLAILQVALILTGCSYGFIRDWSGLQRLILSMHILTVLMKIHAFTRYHCGIEVKKSDYRAKLRHFCYFLCTPTLVYAEDYPKSTKIRLGSMIERSFGIILCGVAMYIVIENHIFPITSHLESVRVLNAQSFLISEFIDCCLRLILPCIAFFLLGFFLVFEHLCGLFAEITLFADRHFYSDWWNGVSFYDFSTRWNIPVHKFLQHYVYRYFLLECKIPKQRSTFLTFLISSLFHELLMFIFLGSHRYSYAFLFSLQMSQLPLISLFVGSGWVKTHPNLSNWIFLLMLSLGLPLIVTFYTIYS